MEKKQTIKHPAPAAFFGAFWFSAWIGKFGICATVEFSVRRFFFYISLVGISMSACAN